MSEEIAKNKRQAATGLGLKVKPLDSDMGHATVDQQPPLMEPQPPIIAPHDPNTKSRLPLISKPVFREASLSARTTSENKRQLEELAKTSGRTVSYLVSELLDAVLPEWIEMQKRSYETRRK